MHQIDRLLGTGGIAKVYTSSEPNISIKLVSRSQPTDQQLALKREFDCLQSLQHPTIVTVYDWIEQSDHIGFSMRHLTGFNGKVFADRLQRLPPSERHKKIISIAIQVLEALEYLHLEGWLHRDIKPSNLMIQDDAKTTLIDFGTVLKLEHQPQVKGLIGTPRYASPEQLQRRRLTYHSDIFSIGATLYYLLLNQSPFTGRDRDSAILPSFIDPTVPSNLENILMTMLSPLPEDRSTPEDLIQRLMQVQTTIVPLAGREEMLHEISLVLRRVHQGEQIHLHINGSRGSGKTWLKNTVLQSANQLDLATLEVTHTSQKNTIVEKIIQRNALLIVSVSPILQYFGIPIIEVHVPWLTLAQVRRSIFSHAPHTTQISLMAERLFALTGGLPFLLLQYLYKYSQNQSFQLPLEPNIPDNSWYPSLSESQTLIMQLFSIIPEPCNVDTIDTILSCSTAEDLAYLKELSLIQQVETDWCIANEWTNIQTTQKHPVMTDVSQQWLRSWRTLTDSQHRPIEDIEVFSASGRLSDAKALGLASLQHTPRSKQAHCLLALGQVYLDIGLLNQANSVLADATALSKAIDDQETYLRSQALRARTALESHHSSPTGATHALDRLGHLVKSNNPWILSVWQWACGALGDQKTWNKWLPKTMDSIQPLHDIQLLRCQYSVIRGACALGDLELAKQLLIPCLERSSAWPLLHWELSRVDSLLHGHPPPIAGSMVYSLQVEEILCFKQRWVRVKGKHPDPTWHH